MASTPPPSDLPPHPRWRRTLYILFIGQAINTLGFSSMFPFLPLYVQQLGSSTGLSLEFLSGMTYSAQAITMMLVSPLWGAAADRFGRKLMVERAMFGGAIILLLMAFARSAEELVLLRAVQGLITGTIAASNAMAAAVAPRQRVGFAMGLLQVGSGLGIALGPIIGGALADRYGYAPAFYVTSASLLASGILIWWGVEETFHKPEKLAGKRPSLAGSYRAILARAGVVKAYSMRLSSQVGRYLILPVAPLFIQSMLPGSDMLNTFTGLTSGIASVTTTLSSVGLGRLSDRIGQRRILIVCGLSAAGLYLAHSLVTQAWQLLALQALVGIALGGIIPAISALLARLTPVDQAGAVYGLDNSIDAAGRSIAPLIGPLVAMAAGMRATFVVAAAMYLILTLLALKEPPSGTHPAS
jgi:MFS transporter, DHA1 family, multidrug resistance protein